MIIFNILFIICILKETKCDTNTNDNSLISTSVPDNNDVVTVAQDKESPTITPFINIKDYKAPPKDEIVNWTWADPETKVVCVMIQSIFNLNITYVNNTDVNETTKYGIAGTNSRVENGTCGKDVQFINVSFGNNFHSNIQISFGLNETANIYFVTNIKLNVNVSDLIENAKANQTITLEHNEQVLATPIGMSYHCTKQQNLTMAWEKHNNTLSLSKTQFEAFHKTQTASYSYSKDCEAINTLDIVPIAVGCALVALIVIVLIAYLIGRRRREVRGYLSM